MLTYNFWVISGWFPAPWRLRPFLRIPLVLRKCKALTSGTCMATMALSYGDGSKPWYLVNPKIAGKWILTHTQISSCYLHCMYLHVTEFCTCSVPGHTDEFHWLANKENLCGSVFCRSLPKTLQITRHWPLGPWATFHEHERLLMASSLKQFAPGLSPRLGTAERRKKQPCKVSNLSASAAQFNTPMTWIIKCSDCTQRAPRTTFDHIWQM